MNIFVTDSCPIKSANNLDNKRLIKMVLESAQLLSTAMTVLGDSRAPYKPTHVNHPCSVWARASKGNYNWLLSHFVALCSVYTERYGKIHKCADFIDLFSEVSVGFPVEEFLPFVNCSLFKEEHDVILAYRKTMEAKWQADKKAPAWGKESNFGGW